MLETDRKGKMTVQLKLNEKESTTVHICFSLVTINGKERVYVLLSDGEENEGYLADLLEKNKVLEQSIEARDSFLAAMSHNLRTPLNSIIGFAEILLAKMPGPLNEEQEEQLRIITRCSKQLLTLIRQLLDVGLIQHHKLDPIFASVDVNAIISDILEEMKPIVMQKGLALISSLVDGPLVLNTDRKFFRQIIVNLLDNAIKYTQEGSVTLQEVYIDANNPDSLKIHVIDTGRGIKKEDLTEIFQLYSTVHKKHDPYGEHTGLGLVLCCKYCEILGMKLTCESVFGKGTCFTIHIPKELIL